MDIVTNSGGPSSISIVISTYNSGPALQVCLASLAEHRNQFTECIIVDDCSTDASMDSAQAFGARIIRTSQRRGPANARNLGALAATGDILLFLDADVCVHDDTIPRILQRFESEPELGAVFGSYDSEPAAGGVVSQFRNLLHCYIHHTSHRQALTFWAGCGAIRRKLFLARGGFDVSYSMPCVEDIEFGMRLARNGVRIALDPSIQVKHLKRWTFGGMVQTDIRYRGIPWARLLLASHRMPNDLNLRISSRASVVLTGLLCLAFVALSIRLLAGAGYGEIVILPLIVLAIAAVNLPFYRFLAAKKNAGFACSSVPLHLTYFFCCGLSMTVAVWLHCWSAVHTARMAIAPARQAGE